MTNSAPKNTRNASIRAFLELLAIVLGILIAFSLDNWGETRKKNEREQQYIQQLNVDFKSNERQLLNVLEMDQIRFDSSAKILDLLKTVPQPGHEDSLAKLLPNILSYSMYIPITGTYEAMISSGDINLIQDDELRSYLVSFAGLLKETQTHLHRFSSWTIDLFNSPAADEFFTADMLLTGNDTSGDIDFSKLLTDRGFKGVVTRLHITTMNKMAFHSSIIAEVKKIKTILMESVGEPGIPEDLNLGRLTGLYEFGPTFHVRISVEGGQLKAQATGQNSFNLYPESATKFYYVLFEAAISFQSAEDGDVTGLTLIQNENESIAKKIE